MATKILTSRNQDNMFPTNARLPKWVRQAFREDKAILLYRADVQEDGYVKINGKVVEPNEKTPYAISGYGRINIYYNVSYNGETITEKTEFDVKVEDALQIIKDSYITHETEVESPRKDLTEYGEFGAQRTLKKTIFNAFGTTVTVQTDIEYAPIGRKVVSYDRKEEIVDKEETTYVPSSAWGMGKAYACTLCTRRVTITRTFEDGQKDVKTFVCKDDRP